MVYFDEKLCVPKPESPMVKNFETLVFKKDGGLGTIILNRPSVLNAYNTKMRDEFWEILNAIKVDDEISVIILKGEGPRAFCTGADLTEFGTSPSPNIARQIRFERAIWELWISIPKPFIACLHGFVIGSGLEMALLCDIRLASSDALFSLPETSLGMLPGAGGTQTIRRTTGLSEGLRILITSAQLDALESQQLGIIHQVVEKDQLEMTSTRIARELLAKDQSLLRTIKLAVTEGTNLPLKQGLELESRLVAQTLASILS